jgi:hypothetical protein
MTSEQTILAEILTNLPEQTEQATPAALQRDPAEVRKHVTERARACGLLGPGEELPEKILETETMVVMRLAAGPVFWALTDECEQEAITQYRASLGQVWTLRNRA